MERDIIIDKAKKWIDADMKNRGGLSILGENEGKGRINISSVTGHNSRIIANGILHLMEKNRDFAKMVLWVVNRYKNEHPFCEIEIL